jgi:hypothetical protein
MPDEMRSKKQMPQTFGFLRVPLFRLLAINLAAGTAVAALLVGGLLALNPFSLRDLIFADSAPGTALGLLLFGFIVTFGSAAMGTAIMATGQRQTGDDESHGPLLRVAQPKSRSIAPMAKLVDRGHQMADRQCRFGVAIEERVGAY